MCVSAISSPFVGPRVSCLSSSELCRIACVSSAFGPPPSPPSLLCQHVRTWLAAYLYPFPISPPYAKALLHVYGRSRTAATGFTSHWLRLISASIAGAVGTSIAQWAEDRARDLLDVDGPAGGDAGAA